MNDEAVYRTAPATPGLLNIVLRTHISFWATISEVGSQKHLNKRGPFCGFFFGSESAFSSDTLTRNEI